MLPMVDCVATVLPPQEQTAIKAADAQVKTGGLVLEADATALSVATVSQQREEEVGETRLPLSK